MIKALQIRYKLLPYYYTLFYKSHLTGSTVIRPLFHEYPKDKNTLDIFLQFLIGSTIMIAPVTDEGAKQVEVYIPSSDWFNYYTGEQYLYSKRFLNISAPLDTIPILLKGGSIIPIQEYGNNTKYSRKNPFSLIIILNSHGNAEGDLFNDDGESLDTIKNKSYYYSKFEWSTKNQELNFNITVNNYPAMSKLILNTIIIYGLKILPMNIKINKKEFHSKIRSFTNIVELNNLSLPMNKNFQLTWSKTESMTIQLPENILTNPKYRVDCYPDPGLNNVYFFFI
jgi:alpha-glucosidase (family GH31 glycosyl hydrolase)